MKLVSFQVATPIGQVDRLGALIDEGDQSRVVDLTAAFEAHLTVNTDEPTPVALANLRVPPDMLGWLRAGHEGRKAAELAMRFVRSFPDRKGLRGQQLIYRRQEIRLLAPLPRPTSLRDCSIYEEHMTNVKIDPHFPGAVNDSKRPEWYTNPPYYKGSVSTIGGPEDPIIWPYYTKRLDPELEIGIVVGKAGRNLTIEEAHNHIAGYTLLIDSSCRDGYLREPFGPNKRKDFHTGLGPWLVTSDEAGDVEDLACRIEVDGELWYEGSTAAPHSFSPAQLVAYMSDNESVEPGDVIGTGTIGLSCSMDSHRWVRIGQTMTFSIERLGSMSLRVVRGEHVVSHVEGISGKLQYVPPAKHSPVP